MQSVNQITYSQPSQVNMMMNVVNIDSHKVEANDSLITGNNNVVFGNNNKIAGNNNKIYGNNNEVLGNNNVIKGEQNRAQGEGNDIAAPFVSSFAPAPQAAPISIPAVRATSPVQESPRKMPMNAYTPPPVSPRTYDPSPSPYATSPVPYGMMPMAPSPVNYPMATSPVNYPMATSPVNNAAAYFQPVASQAIVPVVPQAMVPVVMPQYLAVTPYVNPFMPAAPVPTTVNPFMAYKDQEKEKTKDVLDDGTMVFMINEWESDYVREFCQLVSMTSGEKVSWQVSCGRTCIVGLGNLEKIRAAIVELLPQLNMRLREWSWNSHGSKVCDNRDLFEKRMFKEYTKEDVDCWRNDNPTSPRSANPNPTSPRGSTAKAAA